ncbi:hypothetical protein [Yoonia sp. TsM2_T14_4]|uniref:hypothetical protein n=1 Tax=Yoonia sp. TsM2_T14_4 TaxID=3415141 RepID=UPI003C75C7C7
MMGLIAALTIKICPLPFVPRKVHVVFCADCFPSGPRHAGHGQHHNTVALRMLALAWQRMIAMQGCVNLRCLLAVFYCAFDIGNTHAPLPKSAPVNGMIGQLHARITDLWQSDHRVETDQHQAMPHDHM